MTEGFETGLSQSGSSLAQGTGGHPPSLALVSAHTTLHPGTSDTERASITC